MGRFRKHATIALALLIVLSMVVGCGGGDKPASTTTKAAAEKTTIAESKAEESGIPVINDGKPITIQVELNQLNPTINETPTPEEPNVRNAARELAKEFQKLHPNVEIEFVHKSGDWGEWYTTLIAANNCPDIMHLWGPDATEGDYYLVLDDILQQPNEYYPQVKTWKEQFPEYIWDTGGIKDIHGRIGTLPVALFPGPATGYFYNKDIFDELELEIPVTWEEFIEVAQKCKDAGYVSIAPYQPSTNAALSNISWDVSFSIGPILSQWLIENRGYDYDGDGTVSYAEQLRFGYEKGGNMLSDPDNEYALDLWRQVKRKIDTFADGWQGLDYEKLWLDGKLAMREGGLWELPPERSNTKRTFEFGLFPPPIITKESSPYTVEVEFSDGPNKPEASEYFTVLNPAKQNRPAAKGEAAVQFLKFMTVPENLTKIIFELKGSVLGAVRGVGIPPELNDWIANSFPELPSAPRFRTAYSGDEGDPKIIIEMYLMGMMEEDEFIKRLDEETKKNIESAVKNAERDGFDPSDWKRAW